MTIKKRAIIFKYAEAMRVLDSKLSTIDSLFVLHKDKFITNVELEYLLENLPNKIGHRVLTDYRLSQILEDRDNYKDDHI